MSSQTVTQDPARSKTIRYTSLALRLLAAVAFLAAGGAKLAGIPMMVEIFEHIGLGQWFRIFTGLVEVSAAIALLIPYSAGLAGLLLAITMACAVFTHVFVIGGSPAPGILLGVITASIAWLNRAGLLTLIRPTHA
ncbi:DoxX family protein [Pseudomonas sp. CDFA 602]|uniref:DoxX family protein n=1 Tax=Pseudomonas californiensis TaxID=2829823 RepID=UPI001E519406|nr:DoxX family protein [Pseudomonas californiensis]MCD5996420.1 DoxX family protein [Pseudomonas californiensis]MCD6002019.1 DoxX family protein [Pseudomonas californiensis]